MANFAHETQIDRVQGVWSLLSGVGQLFTSYGGYGACLSGCPAALMNLAALKGFFKSVADEVLCRRYRINVLFWHSRRGMLEWMSSSPFFTGSLQRSGGRRQRAFQQVLDL